MDNTEFVSQPSEEVSSWRRSVVEYVRDAQTSCLDLRIVRWEPVEVKDMDIQPIFDFLVGSQDTEIHWGRHINLSKKIRNLFDVFGKTKIEKLNLESYKLTVVDLMNLMAVLKEARVDQLNISKTGVRLEKSHDIRQFIEHLVDSCLRSLSLPGNFLPLEKMSVFFQRLIGTKLTCLDLTGFFFQELKGFPQEKRAGNVHALMSRLQYTDITDLNLKSNDLGDYSAKEISAFLGKMKLEKLDLSNNKLTDLGVDFLVTGLISSKITHLNLSHNVCSGDNSLGFCLKNTRIKMLDLSNNPITNRRIFSGSNFLRGSEVRTLKLSMCFTSNKLIPLPIKKLRFSGLTCLDLSWNNLCLKEISALAHVFTHSDLTQINLACNYLSKECFSALGKCLVKSKLKYIDLSNFPQIMNSKVRDVSHINGVASFIEKTKGSAIVSVNLSHNDLGQNVGIIASRLANTTFLALDLTRNNLGKDVGILAQQLKFTAIVELNLSNNNIGDTGVRSLVDCLVKTNVIKLGLRDNSITSQGAKALAAVLGKTVLRHLDLEYNQIGDDGLESLAEHAQGTCIICINVENNPGNRKLLIDCAVWKNRKRIQKFADLSKRTAFFTGDSSLFAFDRNFDNIDIDDFIEDCLALYKIVAEDPIIVLSIAQDRCLSDLRKLKRFDSDPLVWGCPTLNDDVDFFAEDCALICQNVLEQFTVQRPAKRDIVYFFLKHILWLMMEEFPKKFVSFIIETNELYSTERNQVTFSKKLS